MLAVGASFVGNPHERPPFGVSSNTHNPTRRASGCQQPSASLGLALRPLSMPASCCGPHFRDSLSRRAIGDAQSSLDVPAVTSSDLRLETERLVLRSWQNGDREPFARLNADPVVMEHFPGVLSWAESDSFAARIDAHFKDHGYGLWAVEVPGDASFIGFVGLSVPSFDAPFMPAVEVGWRIDKAYWGRGFATEAGHAAVADGFERVGLAEIVSFTTPANMRSIRVMERLGMKIGRASCRERV